MADATTFCYCWQKENFSLQFFLLCEIVNLQIVFIALILIKGFSIFFIESFANLKMNDEPGKEADVLD